MKAIEKLTEILCTEESVRKDIMEFRFGCKWINFYTSPKIETVISDIRGWNFYSLIDWFETHFPHKSQIVEILWNDLEERHLRMYCEKKGLLCFFWINKLELWKPWKESNSLWIKINNNLPFHKQSEETLLSIVDDLEINKK